MVGIQQLKSVLKSTIHSADQFVDWLKDAKPRDFCIYHLGDPIAIARGEDERIQDVAEIASILASYNALILSSHRFSVVTGERVAHVATCTGVGYKPSAIMTKKVTGTEWRALMAVDEKIGYLSAQRAVRDAFGCSEDIASQMVRRLIRRGLLSKGQTVKLTPKAQRLIP